MTMPQDVTQLTEPWQLDLNAPGEVLTGADGTEQELRLLITTPKTTVAHDPGRGCDFVDVIDMPRNEANARALRMVRQAVHQYMPHVTIEGVAIVDGDELGHSKLQVTWRPKGAVNNQTFAVAP